MRLLPPDQRFPAVLRGARLLSSGLRRTRRYSARLSHLDGYREETLRLCLRALSIGGAEFSPVMEVRGAELLPVGPAVLVSGHFLLNQLLIRWLDDHHHPASVIATDSPRPPYIAGTATRIDVLVRATGVLVRARGRLQQGRKVLVYADTPLRRISGSICVATSAGESHVSDTIFRFAERTEFPVLFVATRVDPKWRVVSTVQRPTPGDAGSVAREFCEFLRDQAAQIAR